MGGLSINDITLTSDLEYNNSLKATSALTDAIYNQRDTYVINDEEKAKILTSIKSMLET